MLFWKSLENTVSTTPDFREWNWTESWDSNRILSSGTWTRTGTGSWNGTGIGTEKPLSPIELGRGL